MIFKNKYIFLVYLLLYPPSPPESTWANFGTIKMAPRPSRAPKATPPISIFMGLIMTPPVPYCMPLPLPLLP